MKKVIFLSIIALFLSLSVQGQRTNIVVAIAKKSTQCGSTDIGYRMTYGTASNYALGKKAKAAIKGSARGWENIESKNNEEWGKYMGDFMTIITTTTTNSKGCRRFTYGVGFGKSHSSALQNAKSHLKARNWSWKESRDGYRIDTKRRY